MPVIEEPPPEQCYLFRFSRRAPHADDWNAEGPLATMRPTALTPLPSDLLPMPDGMWSYAWMRCRHAAGPDFLCWSHMTGRGFANLVEWIEPRLDSIRQRIESYIESEIIALNYDWDKDNEHE